MEYLSISKAIKEHKGGYEEAYLLSETDDNDVTYFLRCFILLFLIIFTRKTFLMLRNT